MTISAWAHFLLKSVKILNQPQNQAHVHRNHPTPSTNTFQPPFGILRFFSGYSMELVSRISFENQVPNEGQLETVRLHVRWSWTASLVQWDGHSYDSRTQHTT